MICRLFEFETDIGKTKSDKMITTQECEHCGGNICDHCQDINIKKSFHQYSWYISRLLKFPDGYAGGLQDGLKLEHPTFTPVWICRDEDMKFKLFLANKMTPVVCENIKNLNYQLIKLINYSGVPICIEDWL